eukprot:Opistho-1_new@88236
MVRLTRVPFVLQGGIMSVVVPRNTTIPCVRTSIFTTTENNQTQVEFPVYEGERPMTRDNNLLGQFELTGIMPAPKGTPQLEVRASTRVGSRFDPAHAHMLIFLLFPYVKVTFNISADGIMSVKACDLATKRTNQIVIKNDGARLSSADIEKMVEDAKRFKEDDAAVRASIAAKEELTSYIYQVQDTLLSDPTVTAKLKKAVSALLLWLWRGRCVLCCVLGFRVCNRARMSFVHCAAHSRFPCMWTRSLTSRRLRRR